MLICTTNMLCLKSVCVSVETVKIFPLSLMLNKNSLLLSKIPTLKLIAQVEDRRI